MIDTIHRKFTQEHTRKGEIHGPRWGLGQFSPLPLRVAECGILPASTSPYFMSGWVWNSPCFHFTLLYEWLSVEFSLLPLHLTLWVAECGILPASTSPYFMSGWVWNSPCFHFTLLYEWLSVEFSLLPLHLTLWVAECGILPASTSPYFMSGWVWNSPCFHFALLWLQLLTSFSFPISYFFLLAEESSFRANFFKHIILIKVAS